MVNLTMTAKNVSETPLVITNGADFMYSQERPKWKLQNEIQHVKENNHVSFFEARKVVVRPNSAAAEKTYAAMAGISKTMVWCQADLTWLLGGNPLLSSWTRTESQQNKLTKRK